MSRGIERRRRAAMGATSIFGAAAVATMCASLAASTASFAAEPASATRYGDSGLLDAARGGPPVSKGPVNIGLPPADELKILEARRDAELKRLSDKLKRAAAQHGTQNADKPAEQIWPADVATAQRDESSPIGRSALGTPPSTNPDYALATRGRATVLMIMTQKDARATDPILCDADGCYVSNGAQAPATYHNFRESLSLSGRLGRGAGDCNHSNTCVFRNVDLSGSTAMVQPINLKFVRHDRREQSQVTIDETCRVIDGRLSCSRPVRTQGYTLWIVPERLVSEVGPDMLTVALAEGLRTSQRAELPWLRQ